MKSFLSALTLGALAVSTSVAQEPRPVLNHDTAMTIVNTCMAWAEERDLNLTIAIKDQSSRTRVRVEMDDAFPVSWLLADRKAHSALAVRRPTSQMAGLADIPGLAEGGELIPLRGGVIIQNTDGIVLGSVGVSGATGEQDEQCAMAGVEAVGLDHGVESAEE